MKKLFLVSVILISAIVGLNAQNDDASWVYRVNFEQTEEKIDSILSYTNVYMEINQAQLSDSVILAFSISSSFGANDIYFKRKIYTQSLLNSSEVVVANGILRFYLGKYIIKPEIPFIVDLAIEPKAI